MKQPDAVYLSFIDVLKQSGQQHICLTPVEDGYKGAYIVVVFGFFSSVRFTYKQSGVAIAMASVRPFVTRAQVPIINQSA